MQKGLKGFLMVFSTSRLTRRGEPKGQHKKAI